MPTTAVIALSAPTIKSEQRSTATCTLSNTGTADVNVMWLRGHMSVKDGTTESVSSAVGIPPIGGAWPTLIPAGGALNVSFDVIGHAPYSSYDVCAQKAQWIYEVGATAGISDGSQVEATSAELTVNFPAT